jgi:hypothetical protein
VSDTPEVSDISFELRFALGLIAEHAAGDRLCAIAETKLAQDVADVCLDRFAAEHEAVRDLLVGEACCEEAENLELAAG